MEFSELLKKWNADLLKDDGIEEAVSPEHLKAKWLGRSPASLDEIAAGENRLGVDLPQSYREFLLMANGWVYPGNDMDFPGQLRSIDAVAWFKDEDSEWIGAWEETNGQCVSDEEYFVYGEEQDTVTLRSEYLRYCLKISESSEGGVYLLNPKVVSKTGEWEAWHFSDELPGATRCRSFRELVKQQRALFRQMRE
mgnify:CR=1 FL=1